MQEGLKKTAKAGATIALGAMSLKTKLILLLIIVGGGFLFLFMAGVIITVLDNAESGNENTNTRQINIPAGTLPLSPQVEQYRPVVEKYSSKYGVSEYVDVLLAMMMQESGGRGSDPFQSSESKCGYIGCISSPEESIDQGVKYFSQVIEDAGHDVRLALQSYNFGGGFITYVQNNGGSYTKEIAIEFSSMMYSKLKHTGMFSCIHPEYASVGACYGDVKYVDNVLRYYHPVSSNKIAEIAPKSNGEWANPIQESAQITSPFGMRIHPIHGGKKMHKGVDFACVGGVTSINSVDNGIVVHSGFLNGWGNTVVVQHDDDLFSHYAHMSSIDVSKGDQVQQGQKVGVCGSTGDSTGPHLHLEARTGMWDGHFDPMDMLQ